MTLLSGALALVAAALFALAIVLEQRGAMQEPDEEALKPQLIVRLMQRPVWLLGVAADAGGYFVQAAALGSGV
ncbi:MAG: hypothetical protein H0W87_01540 [Actinobacteria bacterium]|nr:hypothetical protein [Actinomycetota bacterium]